jgi:hypothetical protein
MLTGLNIDIEHQGKIYHVQTEDGGIKKPVLITLVYHGGAILASRKKSYTDLLKSKDMNTAIKHLMHEQHNNMIESLKSGQLFKDEGHPTQVPASEVSNKTPITKNLDDLILDYLANKEERKK